MVDSHRGLTLRSNKVITLPAAEMSCLTIPNIRLKFSTSFYLIFFDLILVKAIGNSNVILMKRGILITV